MHALSEKFPLLLHETAAAWRNQLDKRLKPLGLSQAKWRILLHLSLAKEPLIQTELAARLGIEGATLVGLLDRLNQTGWITRQNNSNDRRCKAVFLTQKAQEALVHIHATANQLSEEVLKTLDESELSQCFRVLQHIKQQMDL